MKKLILHYRVDGSTYHNLEKMEFKLRVEIINEIDNNNKNDNLIIKEDLALLYATWCGCESIMNGKWFNIKNKIRLNAMTVILPFSCKAYPLMTVSG